MLNLFCSSGYTHQHQLPVVEYSIYAGGYIGKLNICCLIPILYTVRSKSFRTDFLKNQTH